MGRISRAIELTRQSGRVLLSDKELIVFPILSTIALTFIMVTFLVPMAATIDWQALSNQSGGSGARAIVLKNWHYAVMFAWYFVNFTVMTFFNSALVACAINKFEGRDASVGAGFRAASNCLPQILAWSAIAATVGVILQMIQDKAGWLGKIVIGLIGMVWTIATYFVVPILVVERVGPIDAVRRSVDVLKKTWGETLVANIGIGLITFAAIVAALIPAAVGLTVSILMGSIWPVVIGAPVSLGLIVLVSLVASALKGVLLAATYQYAATGVVPAGFDAESLRSAFRLKGAKA